MINPDAKPGKSSRRRAGSMEAKLLEKKRGRVKKKIAELQASGISPTGISADGTGGDFGFESFAEFRARSDSNLSNYSVSSIGTGRLSPQLEELENEFDAYMPGQAVPEMYPDLVDSIDQSLSLAGDLQNQIGDYQQQSFLNGPINGHHVQYGQSPIKNGPQHSPMRGAGVQQPLHLTAVPASGYLIAQPQPQQISPVLPQQMTYIKPEESSIPPPAYQDLYPVNQMPPQQQQMRAPTGGLMLREALATSPPQKSCGSAAISAVYLVNQGGLGPAGVAPGTVMYQNGDFGGMIYGPPMTTLPSELSDIKFEQMNRQDLIQCNIDEVIRHELQVEGKVDFNSDAFRGL